jgi:hypothetical protein
LDYCSLVAPQALVTVSEVVFVEAKTAWVRYRFQCRSAGDMKNFATYTAE